MEVMELRGKAFTLVELLIVMIIIAILTAIIFPVFTTVRNKAHQATCFSNLSQLGAALKIYTIDYDGRIFANNTFHYPPGKRVFDHQYKTDNRTNNAHHGRNFKSRTKISAGQLFNSTAQIEKPISCNKEHGN